MARPDVDALEVALVSMSVDGQELATFSELQSLTSSIEVAEVLEPTGRDVVLKKLPGRRNPPTVVLKRELGASTGVWDWHQAVVSGDQAARKSCSLVMFNADGKPVARYHLEQAWPSKLEIGSSQAGGRGAMTESVTIVCDDIERLPPT